MIRRALFELKYLLGSTPWDTGITPPELLSYLGFTAPGRAIDLGCGTGTNVITLARHGWDAIGVDMSPIAILRARRKAQRASLPVHFRRLDVTRLPGVQGPFDLALDIGCYHALSGSGRDEYRSRLRRLLPAGADYLLYTWLQTTAQAGEGPPAEAELLADFEPAFSVLSSAYGTDHGRPSAWFHMRRKPG